jgi:hypothetical protein
MWLKVNYTDPSTNFVSTDTAIIVEGLKFHILLCGRKSIVIKKN